jgi:hypothetical protein
VVIKSFTGSFFASRQQYYYIKYWQRKANFVVSRFVAKHASNILALNTEPI